MRTSGYTFHVYDRKVPKGQALTIRKSGGGYQTFGVVKTGVWRKNGKFAKAPKRLDYVKRKEVRKFKDLQKLRNPKPEGRYEKTLKAMKKGGMALDKTQEHYRTYSKRIKKLEEKAKKNRLYELPEDATKIVTTFRFHIALRHQDADDIHYNPDDWTVLNGTTPLGGLEGAIPFGEARKVTHPYDIVDAVSYAQQLLLSGDWYIESSDARYAILYRDPRHGPLALKWYVNKPFNPMDKATWPKDKE